MRSKHRIQGHRRTREGGYFGRGLNRLARANVCGIRRVIRISSTETFQLPRRPLSSSEWQAPKFENRPGTKLQEYTTFRRPVWRPRNERVPLLNSASLSEDFSAADSRACVTARLRSFWRWGIRNMQGASS